MTTESIIAILQVGKIVHNHVAVLAVLTGVICAINDWELINPFISLPSSQVQMQRINQ